MWSQLYRDKLCYQGQVAWLLWTCFPNYLHNSESGLPLRVLSVLTFLWWPEKRRAEPSCSEKQGSPRDLVLSQALFSGSGLGLHLWRTVRWRPSYWVSDRSVSSQALESYSFSALALLTFWVQLLCAGAVLPTVGVYNSVPGLYSPEAPPPSFLYSPRPISNDCQKYLLGAKSPLGEDIGLDQCCTSELPGRCLEGPNVSEAPEEGPGISIYSIFVLSMVSVIYVQVQSTNTK